MKDCNYFQFRKIGSLFQNLPVVHNICYWILMNTEVKTFLVCYISTKNKVYKLTFAFITTLPIWFFFSIFVTIEVVFAFHLSNKSPIWSILWQIQIRTIIKKPIDEKSSKYKLLYHVLQLDKCISFNKIVTILDCCYAPLLLTQITSRT